MEKYHLTFSTSTCLVREGLRRANIYFIIKFCFLSVALMNTMTKSNLGEEGGYVILHLWVTLHHGGKSEQALKAGMKDHLLLEAVLSLTGTHSWLKECGRRPGGRLLAAGSQARA